MCPRRARRAPISAASPSEPRRARVVRCRRRRLGFGEQALSAPEGLSCSRRPIQVSFGRRSRAVMRRMREVARTAVCGRFGGSGLILSRSRCEAELKRSTATPAQTNVSTLTPTRGRPCVGRAVIATLGDEERERATPPVVLARKQDNWGRASRNVTLGSAEVPGSACAAHAPRRAARSIARCDARSEARKRRHSLKALRPRSARRRRSSGSPVPGLRSELTQSQCPRHRPVDLCRAAPNSHR